MYQYKPTPVFIPLGQEVVRTAPGLSSLPEEEQQKFDSRTIFYDVFFDPHSRTLQALGPLPLNLKSQIFPLAIYINDQPVKTHLYQIERLTFLKSEPLPNNIVSPLYIKFEFKTFVCSLELDPSHTNSNDQEYSNARLSITTMQKDNHFEWIEDWVKWHSRLFGVRRLILYDNGSTNRNELISQLTNLEDEVKVIFVDWNYPYGSEDLKKHKFAQHGALNHARLVFPVEDSYCINLDIDEYLVKPDSAKLLDFLDKKLRTAQKGAVIFSQYMIPNIVSSNPGKLPRFHHFPYRFKKLGKPQEQQDKRYSWSEVGRMKYIYKYDKIGYTATHRTASEKNKLFSKRYSIKLKLVYLLKKFLRDALNPIVGNRVPRPRIDAVHVSENELYFWHFLGLTTRWRENPLLERVDFENKIHKKEPLVIELAKRSGLLTTTEK